MRRLSPKYIRRHKDRGAKYLSKPRNPKMLKIITEIRQRTDVHSLGVKLLLLLFFLQLEEEAVNIFVLLDQSEGESPEPVEEEHREEEDAPRVDYHLVYGCSLIDESRSLPKYLSIAPRR
jgi:hypothetical protein